MATKKKKSMQDQVEKDEKGKAGKGEQMDLIDVGPKHSKEIIAQARKYKTIVTKRVKLTSEEVTAKVRLLDMVKAAKLKRLSDGTIKFKIDGITIKVTPRDELIQVTEDKED
jgi:hypothetical protein